MTDVDTQGLVNRARALDADAWAALYEQVYGGLYRYARRRLPSDHAADDAVSETMTRAIDRIDRYSWQGAGFQAWLYGILRNVVHEHRRTTARLVVHDELPMLVPVPTLDDTPVDNVVADEEAVAVRRAFGRLRSEDQELLELRVVAGLSAQDVAEVQGRKPGAVRMAQKRALGRLRELMDEESLGA